MLFKVDLFKQQTALIQFSLQSLHLVADAAVVTILLEILTLVALAAVVIGTHLVVLVMQEVIHQ